MKGYKYHGILTLRERGEDKTLVVISALSTVVKTKNRKPNKIKERRSKAILISIVHGNYLITEIGRTYAWGAL